MFGNLGFGEILMIMVVVLLVFGAKRIPEIAQSMGKGIREFKGALAQAEHPAPLQAPVFPQQQIAPMPQVAAAIQPTPAEAQIPTPPAPPIA